MRNAVVASSLVHVALLVALFAVRMAPSIIVPGPDVIQVSLIDPNASLAVAPPPPPEQKAPDRETLVPTEDTGVKVAPAKPVKPKKEEKREEPPPPQPERAPAVPYAAVGSAGLRGQVSVDTNFEFTYYLLLVRNRIAQGWSPPAGLTNGGKPVKATVYFRIGRGGSLSSVRLETASGFEFFDRSALRSVQLADPMPPLPLGYVGGDLGVHFDFEFVAP